VSEQNTGQAKLSDALTTKGTAFTHTERLKFGLLGLLATAEKTLDQQAEHCRHEFSTRRDDLDKYIYLRALQDRNETLFYRGPSRPYRRDHTHRVHTDRRRGLPALQRDLPAAAGAFRVLSGPQEAPRGAAQPFPVAQLHEGVFE
jgi:hypothetical protein